MSRPKTLLLHLVADLVWAEVGGEKPISADLLTRFKDDPESVMSEYGLDAAARATLFTMDRQVIGEFIRQELLHTPAPSPTDLWSDPLPVISTVTPDKLFTAPEQTLTVHVDCVLATAEVHLMSKDYFNHFVARPLFVPPVPRLKNEKLVATFDLTSAAADEYNVLVYNSPGLAPIWYRSPIKVVRPER